jgi:hypothetical protein
VKAVAATERAALAPKADAPLSLMDQIKAAQGGAVLRKVRLCPEKLMGLSAEGKGLS